MKAITEGKKLIEAVRHFHAEKWHIHSKHIVVLQIAHAVETSHGASQTL